MTQVQWNWLRSKLSSCRLKDGVKLSVSCFVFQPKGSGKIWAWLHTTLWRLRWTRRQQMVVLTTETVKPNTSSNPDCATICMTLGESPSLLCPICNGDGTNKDHIGIWALLAKVHVMACPPGMCQGHGENREIPGTKQNQERSTR